MADHIDDIEVASAYGALDEAALDDGDAASVDALRTLALQANRLGNRRGNYCFQGIWSINDADGESDNRGQIGIAPPDWIPVISPAPIRVEKTFGIETYDLRIIARISSGFTVWIQLETDAAPFVDVGAATPKNVIAMLGTDAYEVYSLAGVPARRGAVDHLRFLLRGQPTGVAGSEVLFGANNTGTVHWIDNGGTRMVPSTGAASWTQPPASPTYAEGGHAVHIQTGAGLILVRPRLITLLFSVGGIPFVDFWPPIESEAIARGAAGQIWAFTELPIFRLASVCVAPAERGWA